MLTGKKPFSLNIAHKMAMNLEKPYMYLCADITEPHQISYDDVKRTAVVTNEGNGSLYFLGSHEDVLKQFAIYHFATRGFRYSALNVDGFRTNGDINVGFWLTKPDLIANGPKNYENVLSDVTIIEVCRPATWQKLQEASEPDKFAIYAQMAQLMGRNDPHFLYPVYQIAFNHHRIPDAGPGGHIIMGPELFGLYGGRPAPLEYAREFEDLRKNPERIRSSRAELLKKYS